MLLLSRIIKKGGNAECARSAEDVLCDLRDSCFKFFRLMTRNWAGRGVVGADCAHQMNLVADKEWRPGRRLTNSAEEEVDARLGSVDGDDSSTRERVLIGSDAAAPEFEALEPLPPLARAVHFFKRRVFVAALLRNSVSFCRSAKRPQAPARRRHAD